MPIFDVSIPYDEILARRKRLDLAYRFEKPDRTPVLAPFHARYFLEKLGIPARQYFFDAATMLYVQTWGKAWVLNNVRTDFTELGAGVDMGHYFESWALGCELDFDAFTPWIKVHPIQQAKDVEAVAQRDILDNPMIAHEAVMRKRMSEMAGDYALRFACGKVIYPAETLRPPLGSTGIVTVAADLRGADFYLDFKLNPVLVERLMEIVTEKVIQYQDWARREFGYPKENVYLCDDAAAQLSPADYRRFVLPYNRRVKERYGGKLTLHCCGPAGHLVPIWADELGVDIKWNFSYETDRRKVARYMGGKTVLVGNVNWKLIMQGTPAEVYADACDTLEAFRDYRGHILSSPNIAPGVRVENLNAMVEAASSDKV